MISNISSDIVSTLIRNKIINVSEKAIYQYGFEILISSIITYVIVLIEGLVFKCILASCIYFFIFAILRSVCGGFHCRTYFSCNLLFTVVSIIVIAFFKFIPIDEFKEMHYISLLFSIFVTYLYSPVENINKPLSLKQKKLSRLFGTLIVFFLTLLSSVLTIYFRSSYSILIDMTLFVVAFSMFLTDTKKGGKSG